MIAFGHPFLDKGSSGYFMHNAYILTIVPSQNIPFKLGSVGAEIGVVNQDRGAGISGVSGITPIPCVFMLMFLIWISTGARTLMYA